MHQRLVATICADPFLFGLQPFRWLLRRSHLIRIADSSSALRSAIRHNFFYVGGLRSSNPALTFERKLTVTRLGRKESFLNPYEDGVTRNGNCRTGKHRRNKWRLQEAVLSLP